MAMALAGGIMSGYDLTTDERNLAYRLANEAVPAVGMKEESK